MEKKIIEIEESYLLELQQKIESLEKELQLLNEEKGSTRKFLNDHLRMWEDEGIPAPLNELQSIHAWLGMLGSKGEKETAQAMRLRMTLLMKASGDLHRQGEEAEKEAGIYTNRPDLNPNKTS